MLNLRTKPSVRRYCMSVFQNSGWILLGLSSLAWAAPDPSLDPKTCQQCHPDHYREWAGSMHAYAVKDPVFLAMNRLGQDATQGRLGDFCVRCHAPLAVRLGLTHDGRNLDQVPEALHGVTCAFCHQVDAVTGDHNNALHLAQDGRFRASLSQPQTNPVHGSTYSRLHDAARAESSALCGSCHDIVTPRGVALERTYQEWRHSFYAKPSSAGGLSCIACHMPGRDGQAATGGPPRRIHAHRWPGVDVALEEDFPDRDAQRDAVQTLLDTTLGSRLCVVKTKTAVELRVTLENLAAGHAFPSGAAQDRRLWVAISAWKNGREVFASGHQGPETTRHDADRPWLFRDALRDVHGAETHRFWEAARILPNTLPVAAPGRADAHRQRIYRYTAAELPDEVRLAVHLQPIGRDVLDELVRLNYLEAEDREQVPTFTLAGASQVWRPGAACVGLPMPAHTPR